MKSIVDSHKMCWFCVFFCKHIGDIAFSSNMFDLYKGLLHIFADCIFVNLNIAEAFGHHIVRPLDGGSIVIVDSDGTIEEFMEDTEIEENISNVLELLGALVE